MLRIIIEFTAGDGDIAGADHVVQIGPAISLIPISGHIVEGDIAVRVSSQAADIIIVERIRAGQGDAAGGGAEGVDQMGTITSLIPIGGDVVESDVAIRESPKASPLIIVERIRAGQGDLAGAEGVDQIGSPIIIPIGGDVVEGDVAFRESPQAMPLIIVERIRAVQGDVAGAVGVV